MKETLLDLDHVPTMEELREYFHKHDFSSACYYTSASKWEEDELCKDDREAVNEMKKMVKREWNDLSSQKGLKSKPANYDNENNSLFLRNNYETDGKWGIPVVKKQELDTSNVRLIACSDTKTNDYEENRKCGVHFFVDDYRFSGIYDNPDRSLERYSQYSFLLTPDFSTYSDMDLWRQLESVAKNRWVGAYWQSKGNTVIPTVSWSDANSFEFCFDGIEQGGTVAVGMIGCKHSRVGFMRGYNEMLERLKPEIVIVFGTPFPEMKGNIVPVDYQSSRKVVR